MKNGQKTIKIDYGDWYKQWAEEEPDVSSEASLIDLAREGMSTTRIAQHAITARAEGVAPSDILPVNKLLLLSGARAHVGVTLANRWREVEFDNGKTYDVREFVAPVREEDHNGNSAAIADEVQPIDDRGWIDSADPLAAERAAQYLTRRVPGHIWNRLVIIASNDGDVTGVASELHAKIDEMVERLQ